MCDNLSPYRFATFFWPREGVSYQKLQAIHAKMINVSILSALRGNPLLTPVSSLSGFCSGSSACTQDGSDIRKFF